MPYERLKDIVRLAVRLQGTHGGLTLDDIQADFSVKRRTAERMRDAVSDVFGALERVDTGDTKHHWRLRSDAVRRLVAVSPADLAELESAASALARAGLEERAATLREFATTVRATLRTESLARIESELEALVQAEGLAMRAGPRARLDTGLLSKLREAITTRRMVEFRYFAQATGRHSRQRVRPLGLLYGNRAFLVASSDWREEPRLWRLANVSELCIITDETFERDPEFDLERYAKRSFGTFQEEPVGIVLRFDAAAARDASTFTFHPDQSTESNDDGSLTVRFEAGGIDEMCWHLFTWGESVTIEEPLRLRRRLAEMSARLAAHHGGTARSMNETTTSGGAASVPAGAGSFGRRERKRQAAFRKGLTIPTDAIGLKHDYLLALGCEEENLFPTLRGEDGALRYFAERNIKWWQARVSGDASDGKRPTRNMASSQIACVNFLLPLVDIPGALTAVLKAIDDDVTGVVAIEHEGTSSPVELEWIGLGHALEGPGVTSRGANSTSVDAFMVAETPGRAPPRLSNGVEVRRGVPDRRQGPGTAGRDTTQAVRPPLREVPILQPQGPLRRMALRTLLPDPPPPPPRRPHGPQPRARGQRRKGRGRRPGGKSRVPKARDVATARLGVPGPDSLRHRRGDSCPPRPRVCISLTIEPGQLRPKPVRRRNGGLGSLPP